MAIGRAEYLVEKGLNLLVLHLHDEGRPGVMHACLILEDREEYLFFHPDVPFEAKAEFPEISCGLVPSVGVDSGLEALVDAVEPPVVGLEILGYGPVRVRGLPLHDAHPPGLLALLKRPPVEFAVVLCLE